MIKRIIGEVKFYRILILTLLIVSTGILILQDYSRLTKDFSNLMSFLANTRLKAIQDDIVLIAQFKRENVIVKDKKDNILDLLNVSTLHKVNYDSKLGKNMIYWQNSLLNFKHRLFIPDKQKSLNNLYSFKTKRGNIYG